MCLSIDNLQTEISQNEFEPSPSRPQGLRSQDPERVRTLRRICNGIKLGPSGQEDGGIALRGLSVEACVAAHTRTRMTQRRQHLERPTLYHNFRIIHGGQPFLKGTLGCPRPYHPKSSQRVHVPVQYISGPQRGSYILTLGPMYLRYSDS